MNSTGSLASETLVELVSVSKSYRFGSDIVRALDGVDLRIERGGFVGVIGRSGSGKSTLLNILGGLDRPTSGQVLVEGRSLDARRSDDLAAYRRRTVGFIFQSFNLIAHLTALENVMLPLRLAGEQGYFERRRRSRALLERVGLGRRLGHRPAELSGGERQRVAIARALANEPRILLADEPTGNLDSRTANEIMSVLCELNTQAEHTIVLVTHDRAQAERICKRIIVLVDGRIQEDFRPSASGEPPGEPPGPASGPAPPPGPARTEAA